MPLLVSAPPDNYDHAMRSSRAYLCFYVFVTAYIVFTFLSLLTPGLKLVPGVVWPSPESAADPNAVQTLLPFITRLVIAAVALTWLIAVAAIKPQMDRLNRSVLVGVVVLYLTFVAASGVEHTWGQAKHEHLFAAVSGDGLVRVFLHHLLPALVLTWVLREALIALLPIVFVEAVLIVLANQQASASQPALPVSFAYLLLVCLPGLLVAWVRQGGVGHRLHVRPYKEAYANITDEIGSARKLHDALFPDPIDTGSVRLDYCYRPMTHLGGDYLHAYLHQEKEDAPASLVCTLVDVTGHGLRATLAVNQLHALLQHQAQQPGRPDPGTLIAELNRYVCSDCSGHGVFATAVCLRLDPAENRVVWCSAGHPPAIVIDQGVCKPALESTAPMLGACDPEDFDPDSQSMTLHPGAEILAYSDGAIEKRLAIGKLLGVSGLCMFIGRVLARDQLNCASLMDSLATLNAGLRDDDILLVRVGFSDNDSLTEEETATQSEAALVG